MLDDEALLAHWRDGDRSAGDALFERHFKSVRRFFKSKVGPSHAEDLIQRTFLGCIKSLPGYRGDASFRTYLFAVARNVLYMHFRRLHRRPGLEPDASIHNVVDLKTGVSTAVGKQDERRLIQVALRHLPIEAQTLLELTYWEGLTAAELAAVFGVSPVTIRTRTHRRSEAPSKPDRRPPGVRTRENSAQHRHPASTGGPRTHWRSKATSKPDRAPARG